MYKGKDTEAVHLISNYHGTDASTVQRKEKYGINVTVYVTDYIKHMGGVDKHYMLKQIYDINRNCVKWWHRLFFGLFDMAVVNSFIVYKEQTQSAMTLLEYRWEI